MELEAQLKQSAARLKNFGQSGDSAISKSPKAGEKIKETFTSLKDKLKKEPMPAESSEPPKPEKEIPVFETKPVTAFHSGETAELTQAREKYINTYQKDVFDKYHQKGRIGKVLTKIPFNQTYKEKKWTEELKEAKENYEQALADYGQQSINNGESTADVFEQLIINEEKKLQEERLNGYPQEEKGIIERCLNKGLEKWRKMPNWKRALVSTAIGTGGLALGTAVGTGGLALGGVAITGYALKRFTGSMVAYYLTTPASGAILGFVSKISSKKIEAGKEEKTTEIIEKLDKTIDFKDAMKQYQEVKSKADKKEMKSKLITQGGVLAMGLAAGGMSSILLSDLFGQAPALASNLPKTSATVETATSTPVHKLGFWERLFPDKGKIADEKYVNKKLPLEKLIIAVQEKIKDFEKKGILSYKEVNELAKLQGAFNADDVDRIALYSPKNQAELDQFLKEKKYPDMYKGWFKVEDNGTIKGADNSSWEKAQFEIDKETGALIKDDNNLYLPGADGDTIEGLQRKPTSAEIEKILKMRQDLEGKLPDEVKTKIVEEINQSGGDGLKGVEADKIVSDFSASNQLPSADVSSTTSSVTALSSADSYTIKVEKGGSVWKSAKQTLSNIYGDFNDLPQAKQNVFIDWIKDRVAEKPGDFSLTGDINKIQIGQQINFKSIFEDQNSDMFKHFNDILKEAKNLTAQEINKKLRHEWF